MDAPCQLTHGRTGDDMSRIDGDCFVAQSLCRNFPASRYLITGKLLQRVAHQYLIAAFDHIITGCLPHHAGALAWIAKTRSEEHTSELQSLMRTSYAVFCLKKKKNIIK